MTAHPRMRTAAWAVAALCALSAPQAFATSFCVPGPGDRPETGLQGGVPGSERQAPNGFQGFWCGARKVGQHALYNRGSFGDLQVIVDERGSCAYASMRDPSDLTHPTTGTVVLDISVPSKPVDVQVLRTPAMIRAYSALEIPVSQATGRPGNTMAAAFKDFGPNGTNPLDVYDVSGDCLNPVSKSSFNVASGNHDGWLTPDGTTYYGVPFGSPAGQDPDIRNNPNRVDLHVTDVSDPSAPKHLLSWNRRQLPADVYERLSGTRNFHDVSSNDKGTRIYVALYGGTSPLGGGGAEAGRCANGLLILDSTDIAMRKADPALKFVSWTSWCDQQIDPDFGDGSTGASHATEYVIHENGKEYVVTTDENNALTGSITGMCQQRSYARLIDISDEKNPKIVSTFKTDVNKPENCAANMATNTTGGMVHYLNFDDRYRMRVVAYAASNQGIRFVDFRDPAHPKEIAYYNKERHVAESAPPAALFPNFTTGSTSVTGTDFSRPDPRFDSENCLWYTGWNQGGLVSVELTRPEYNACMRRHASGGGWLAKGSARVNVTFNVQRSDGGHGDALEGSFRLSDRAANAEVVLNELTFLGSVRDECGGVSARADSVQFEGTGTFNGKPASFRVCARDNGEGRRPDGAGTRTDDFHLACTAGCDYSMAGRLNGNVQVRQR